MKDIKEIFVLYNPYTQGYYDGVGFRGILFAKKYYTRETAVTDVGNILSNRMGIDYIKIEKLYTI
jgi:hypothetical protein